MAKKLKLTRPELKRHRDMLTRFERYLPMLKLKQQQLQMTVLGVRAAVRAAEQAAQAARHKFQSYRAVLKDTAGIDLRRLATAEEVRATSTNIAGVTIPVFEDVVFPPADYSLFATPAWVDAALADLRAVTRRQAELDILRRQMHLLQRELTRIIQRVNLFEKVKIPQAQEAIRLIRIQLGDEMTAAVGRSKLAKRKLAGPESRGAHRPGAPADEVEATA